MEALYKIKADQIDNNFIESIKKLFADEEIVIRITSYADDTEYLSKYPANEKHILENMVAEPAKRFTGDEFNEHSSKKR